LSKTNYQAINNQIGGVNCPSIIHGQLYIYHISDKNGVVFDTENATYKHVTYEHKTFNQVTTPNEQGGYDFFDELLSDECKTHNILIYIDATSMTDDTTKDFKLINGKIVKQFIDHIAQFTNHISEGNNLKIFKKNITYAGVVMKELNDAIKSADIEQYITKKINEKISNGEDTQNGGGNTSTKNKSATSKTKTKTKQPVHIATNLTTEQKDLIDNLFEKDVNCINKINDVINNIAVASFKQNITKIRKIFGNNNASADKLIKSIQQKIPAAFKIDVIEYGMLDSVESIKSAIAKMAAIITKLETVKNKMNYNMNGLANDINAAVTGLSILDNAIIYSEHTESNKMDRINMIIENKIKNIHNKFMNISIICYTNKRSKTINNFHYEEDGSFPVICDKQYQANNVFRKNINISTNTEIVNKNDKFIMEMTHTADKKMPYGNCYKILYKIYKKGKLTGNWWYDMYTNVPSCAFGRLAQSTGTCWANSSINILLLTTKIKKMFKLKWDNMDSNNEDNIFKQKIIAKYSSFSDIIPACKSGDCAVINAGKVTRNGNPVALNNVSLRELVCAIFYLSVIKNVKPSDETHNFMTLLAAMIKGSDEHHNEYHYISSILGFKYGDAHFPGLGIHVLLSIILPDDQFYVYPEQIQNVDTLVKVLTDNMPENTVPNLIFIKNCYLQFAPMTITINNHIYMLKAGTLGLVSPDNKDAHAITCLKCGSDYYMYDSNGIIVYVDWYDNSSNNIFTSYKKKAQMENWETFLDTLIYMRIPIPT